MILTVVLLALLPNAANAFKMPSVPGAPGATEESEEKDGSKESTVSAADSQDALVSQFKETLGSILLAQKHFAAAFKDADSEKEISIQIASLAGENCGSDCTKRAVEVSAAASKAIEEKLESKAVISAEGKAHYLKAIPPYLKGTLSAKDLVTTAGDWSKLALGEIKAAGLRKAPKLKKKLDSGMFVAKQTPGLIKNWVEASKKIFTYAKATDIKLDGIKGANDFDMGDS